MLPLMIATPGFILDFLGNMMRIAITFDDISCSSPPFKTRTANLQHNERLADLHLMERAPTLHQVSVISHLFSGLDQRFFQYEQARARSF